VFLLFFPFIEAEEAPKPTAKVAAVVEEDHNDEIESVYNYKG